MLENRIDRSLARTILLVVINAAGLQALAQRPDSIRTVDLNVHEVVGPMQFGMKPAADTLGAVIMAGRRTEVVTLSATDADLSQNQARQVFAKVPGITVWENDGSGVQLGIAARGLSPNRSWEFNTRQNGHDISADVFGYPEAYYTPPMAAVERIEVVRGAASLAFGPQFGGLVNFVLKKGPRDRPLAFETRQTAGSYGLFDSYNALGGSKGKWSYYTFLHHRSADGWRANSRYSTTAGHAGVQYRASRKLRLGLEYTRSDVRQQQPGGLTGVLALDPRSSSRERNWMLLPWNVGAATLEWRPNDRTLVDVKLFGTIAERNSVGFLRPINEPDTINRATGAYAERQVDRDSYTNYGVEARVRRGWTFRGRQAYVAAGVRGYTAQNLRRQQGRGTTGTDADVSITGSFGRELDLTTRNAALHAEVLLPLTDRLDLVPGARFEHITSRVDGRINATSTGGVDSGERLRQLPLLGIGAQYRTSERSRLYANFSQAYRPVLFSDLTPSATTDVIDPDLQDASGYNLDGGFRGNVGGFLAFDIGGFMLHYDNRIGTILRDGANYRTNIGASLSQGVEAYVEAELLDLLRGGPEGGTHLAVFVSYAFVDARYSSWNDPAVSDDPSRDLVGNQVEYAPRNILRPGITYRDKHLTVALKVSVVDGVYTNATNTEASNASATAGYLKGYTVADANATWRFDQRIALTVGVNNLLDEIYATRRAGGYPGPGLLPGMGRTGFLTLEAKF
ncbi:MAG TPA: TonB-dependent receptor [Flavobacteriales bacterium]|nr:TonB-dependent receptor [Flavobacteriales bacterium]